MGWAIKTATEDTDADVIADGLAWTLQGDPYELTKIRPIPPRGIRALLPRLHSLELGNDDSKRLGICVREMVEIGRGEGREREGVHRLTDCKCGAGSRVASTHPCCGLRYWGLFNVSAMKRMPRIGGCALFFDIRMRRT